MSIIDKFLDVMRLNDDDYEFDNEDYDYDEEEDYEVKEKKPSRPGFFASDFDSFLFRIDAK